MIKKLQNWDCDFCYINYNEMKVFCWSIKLPDPTHYEQTFDIKAEQKAKALYIDEAFCNYFESYGET